MSNYGLSKAELQDLEQYLATTMFGFNLAMAHGFMTALVSLPVEDELLEDGFAALLDLEQVPEDIDVSYLVTTLEKMTHITCEHILFGHTAIFLLSNKGFIERVNKNKLQSIADWCLGYSISVSRYQPIIDSLELEQNIKDEIYKCYDIIDFMAELSSSFATTDNQPEINAEIKEDAVLVAEKHKMRLEVMADLKTIVRHIFEGWNDLTEDELTDASIFSATENPNLKTQFRPIEDSEDLDNLEEYEDAETYSYISEQELELIELKNANTATQTSTIHKNNSHHRHDPSCPCGSGNTYANCCELELQACSVH